MCLCAVQMNRCPLCLLGFLHHYNFTFLEKENKSRAGGSGAESLLLRTSRANQKTCWSSSCELTERRPEVRLKNTGLEASLHPWRLAGVGLVLERVAWGEIQFPLSAAF